MSTESRPLKLSKKLKFKFNTKTPSKKSPAQNRENGTRNSKSSPRDDHQVRGGRGKEEVNRKGDFKTDRDQQWNAKSSVRGKQFIGSRNEVKGRENFKPVGSDSKRKRIYADQEYKSNETLGHTYSRKPLSYNGPNHLKNGFAKGKNSNNSQRTIWGSNKVKDGSTNSRSASPKHAEVHDGKRRTNAGEVKLVSSKVENKSQSNKYLDQSQNKHLMAYPSPRSPNKIVLVKNGMNSEATDGRPKKKRKRGIRLDPHDMSNKRLDDSIESPKEKRDNLEKNVETSKNAQFRAIQPSPSILSYVEENLLGRRRLIELRRAGYNINLNAPLDNVPSSEDSERMRIEENIFRNKMTFFAAAKVSSSFPPPDFPEVAFAGRSNVGKSSLLNSLTRQWGVARTSDKPGLTQSINFFELGSKLCLVDLPGYGFAYAKEEVKDAWEDLVKEYVSTRVGLKQVCLLVDTKWGLKPRDHELIELMERSETKYQIVLTKTDLVFPMDVARRAMQIEENLKAKKSIVQPLMMVSSKTGAGIRSLRTVLGKIARLKV